MHMNFAQSRIPALVCPQLECGCLQACSQGNATHKSKVFRLIKHLNYKPKKHFSANYKSTKLPQRNYPTSAFGRIQTCI